MNDWSVGCARGGPHPRVTKTGAKKCRPHKNDVIASNTIDVRRCNFRCAHRTQAIERSAAAGMRFELRFAIRGDAWAVAKFSLVAR
jgi:hypothetical protein